MHLALSCYRLTLFLVILLVGLVTGSAVLDGELFQPREL